MKETLVILALIGLTNAAFAEELAPAVLLRKFSMHLRGRPPTALDYAELRGAGVDRNAIEAVLAKKVDDFLVDPGFVQDLRARLFESIRFESEPTSELGIAANPGAAVLLSEEVIAQNRSWDDLWTRRTIPAMRAIFDDPTIAQPARGLAIFQSTTEERFFAPLTPSALVPLSSRDVSYSAGGETRTYRLERYEHRFDARDPRVAGLITTPRFVSRFANAGLNKSRKRAAAIFRLLLCDPMSVAIQTGGEARKGDVDAIFEEPIAPGAGSGKDPALDRLLQEMNQSAEKRHGAEASCMACHYKLDPMGQTLQALGSVLSPMSFPGALVFKGADGAAVNQPVRGIGALMDAIVARPEYVSCQTNWFWKTYIGSDVPLSSERHRELDQLFNERGRRPKDFVKALVLSPEFRLRPHVEGAIAFARVKPLLRRCDSCHGGELPLFESAPIGGTAETHATWIASMKDRLNRPEGALGRMPRNSKEWDPKEIETLKLWLAQGASYEH